MADCKIYMLYNANGSVIGKLHYGYRKITSNKSGESECAACDITHGGLSLSETASWVSAKKQLTEKNVEVVQLHRDELLPNVKQYVQENKIGYPVALIERDGKLQVAMDKAELGSCNGDAQTFVKKLEDKGVFS